jgi:hypothetical protein
MAEGGRGIGTHADEHTSRVGGDARGRAAPAARGEARATVRAKGRGAPARDVRERGSDVVEEHVATIHRDGDAAAIRMPRQLPIGAAGTCQNTAPQLFRAAKVYAASNLVFGAVVCINGVGLYSIMSYMTRNGLLRTKDGAPAGTLEKMRVKRFDPELKEFKDSPECCVCLAAFDTSQEIRVTSCGHAFHGRCLGNWLKVNRTCPLCRRDLAAAVLGPGETARGPEAPQQRGDRAPPPACPPEALPIGRLTAEGDP